MAAVAQSANWWRRSRIPRYARSSDARARSLGHCRRRGSQTSPRLSTPAPALGDPVVSYLLSLPLPVFSTSSPRRWRVAMYSSSRSGSPLRRRCCRPRCRRRRSHGTRVFHPRDSTSHCPRAGLESYSGTCAQRTEFADRYVSHTPDRYTRAERTAVSPWCNAACASNCCAGPGCKVRLG